jgi:hypothetical protein
MPYHVPFNPSEPCQDKRDLQSPRAERLTITFLSEIHQTIEPLKKDQEGRFVSWFSF